MKISLSLLLFVNLSTLLAGMPHGMDFQSDTLSAEKVFVQTDQPYYLSGETVSYKAHLVSYNSFALSSASEVLHVSLWNSDLEVLIDQRVELIDGFGYGKFKLPSDIPSGNYLLVSYTNWMLNFPGMSYNKRQFYVINPSAEELPPTNSELTAQFFPEGDKIIANHSNRLAFRFNDLQQNIEGWVVNQIGDTLSQFKTYKQGYGVVDILAKANESYSALVNHKGKAYKFPLGQSKSNTAAIRLMDRDTDNLSVTVNIGDSYNDEKLILQVQNRGKVILSAEQKTLRPSVKFIIPKNLFKKGLNQIVILNENDELISERLIFSKPELSIWANVRSEDTQIKSRSKVVIPISINTASSSNRKIKLSVSIKNAGYFPSKSTDRIDYNIDLFSEINFVPPSADFIGELSDSEFLEAFLITQKLAAFSVGNLSLDTPNDRPFYQIEKGTLIPVSGKVTDNGKPIVDSTIYLSILGDRPQFHTAKLDDKGSFNLAVYPFYGKSDMILKLANAQENRDNITYKVEKTFPTVKKSDFEAFYPLDIVKLKKYLKLKSDNEMIERIYYPSPPSVESKNTEEGRFFFNYNFTMDYTEYIRLNDFKEIKSELIENITLGKNDDELRVRKYDEKRDWFLDPYENSPLILIDGLPVYDSKRVIGMSPERIKTISIMNNQFYVGGVIFDGIFEMTTVNADYYKNEKSNHSIFNLHGYYKQDLNNLSNNPRQGITNSLSQLPDFRSVLLWNPNLEATTGEVVNIEFFTSDDIGDFLLEVQGIDELGNILHYEKVLSVR